ncbi:unnamed protein product [Allacma fusca]|uniref:Uncharacterized protein n=1 Tax=Allacma fusca TaxID=39272 RepID=A0A8J2MGC6_9HEXA|nr:unnamed protein product [Allacma fusca]
MSICGSQLQMMILNRKPDDFRRQVVLKTSRQKVTVTLPQAPVFLPTTDLFNIKDVNGICTGENQPLIIDILAKPPPGETNDIGANVEACGSQRPNTSTG